MDHKVERGRFAKFLSLSAKERQFFLEAFVLQMWVGLLLKIIPFRWIPKLFKDKVQRTRNQEDGGHHLEQIKTAIQRATIFSPWENKCLVQSLAARCMLSRRRIPSRLSLGVTLGTDKKVIAHAWMKSGDVELVEKRGNFQELYVF